LRSQVGSSHSRHDEIGDQDVDGACVRLGHGPCVQAVGRRQHVIPAVLQGPAQKVSYAYVVVNQEDGFGTLRSLQRTGPQLRGVERLVDAGQIDLEHGASLSTQM